jgi:signal transduction histidine kinase
VAITELVSLVILALLAERLTHADRNERVVLSSANREVEAARQRMSALINSMADGVIAIDTTQRITLYNGAALDLLNTNRALTGQTIDQVLDVIDTSGKKIHWASFLSHPGVVKRNDWVLRLGEDSSINLDVSVSPIHINQQEDDGRILLLRDITRQKTLDQERDEFISVTSHELRTPVAIAEANLSTALLPAFAKLEPKVKNLLEQAHDNIVFLGQLIKDLSTLSRAERGLLKVDISSVDPVQLIDQLGSDYQASALTKGLDLKVEHPQAIKPIQTSLNLIHEIMQNFITNAIKYTEKGSVTLRAEPAPGNHGVVLSVTDTGIGISAADQKQLFSKFFRSEDYRTRQTNGTGLGLYITKRLAQRMGGQIWVKSSLDHGSTFSVSIPAHPALKLSSGGPGVSA